MVNRSCFQRGYKEQTLEKNFPISKPDLLFPLYWAGRKEIEQWSSLLPGTMPNRNTPQDWGWRRRVEEEPASNKKYRQPMGMCRYSSQKNQPQWQHGLRSGFAGSIRNIACGMPMFGGYAGNFSIWYSPAWFKQIEIIKVLVNLYGGGAIAGMLNVISKKTKKGCPEEAWCCNQPRCRNPTTSYLSDE